MWVIILSFITIEDSSKGREIVIPAGSKAIDYYKPPMVEENLMISWTRIIVALSASGEAQNAREFI
jgi:hypothetical protein